MNNLPADLKRLTGLPAPSGREGPAGSAVRKSRECHGEVREDGLGNVGFTVGEGDRTSPLLWSCTPSRGVEPLSAPRPVASHAPTDELESSIVIPAHAGMKSARRFVDRTIVIPAQAGIQSTQRIGRTSVHAHQDTTRRFVLAIGSRP